MKLVAFPINSFQINRRPRNANVSIASRSISFPAVRSTRDESLAFPTRVSMRIYRKILQSYRVSPDHHSRLHIRRRRSRATNHADTLRGEGGKTNTKKRSPLSSRKSYRLLNQPLPHHLIQLKSRCEKPTTTKHTSQAIPPSKPHSNPSTPSPSPFIPKSSQKHNPQTPTPFEMPHPRSYHPKRRREGGAHANPSLDHGTALPDRR